jgi:outer membrane protein OmpA-like peptidoglycan-associated protein
VVSPEKRTGRYLNLAVEFDVDSYALRQSSVDLLAELGKALSDPRLAGMDFYVNGHTDSDGSDNYNLKLSYDRAESVKRYLVGNFGISSDRLLVRGYGEGMPVAANTSAANKQLNRRVEIVAVP